MKHRCKMCGNLTECRKVIIGGIFRGYYCNKHFLQYMDAIERIMNKHNCTEKEAEKIAESLAKEHLRKKKRRS